MSELKATPGPWVAYPDMSSNCFYIAQQDGAPYTSGYSDVCGLKCHTWSGERFVVQEANAHLIAQSPAMYSFIERLVDDGLLDSGWREEAESLLAHARGE